MTIKIADLLDRETHIWSVVPESISDNQILKRCVSILSESEIEQYHRFRFSEDRHRYLVSHALVRYSLSKYADIPPSEWVFESKPKGRPEIANPEAPPLRFNLTHTSGLSACVITCGGMCGIDAEKTDARHDVAALANRMFSPDEFRQLLALQGQARLDFFFSRWTLREAYVKATGMGISFPTRKLSFNIDGDNNVRIAFEPGIDETPGEWRFELYQPTREHHMAIALSGQELKNRMVVRRPFVF